MKQNKKQIFWRMLLYFAGCILLAVGITLSTKTGLGVSSIISVPFVVSEIWGVNFAAATFVVYSIMVGIQFLLRGKNYRMSDLLQIPFSLVFSWFLNLFGSVIRLSSDSVWVRLFFLCIAIVMTGCGAATMSNMRLIMNPADALAQTVGEVLNKDMGFGKNLIDFLSVALSVILCLVFRGSLTGIGLGTVLAMVGIGRVIAVFNRCLKKRMLDVSGLT